MQSIAIYGIIRMQQHVIQHNQANPHQDYINQKDPSRLIT